MNGAHPTLRLSESILSNCVCCDILCKCQNALISAFRCLQAAVIRRFDPNLQVDTPLYTDERVKDFVKNGIKKCFIVYAGFKTE